MHPGIAREGSKADFHRDLKQETTPVPKLASLERFCPISE